MPAKLLRSPFELAIALTMSIGCVFSLIGCGDVADSVSDVSEGTAKTSGFDADSVWLASKPPGDVITPTAVKEAEGEALVATVAGRIDAGDMSPFQSGQLAFMLSQLPEAGHESDDPDHADNCPFCKRKLANAPKAIVQWVGDDGSVLAGDVQAALGLKKGEVIWATGKAQYIAAVNTVIIDASGLYRPTVSDPTTGIDQPADPLLTK